MALTGSASRGLADAHSDIELNAWGHELPPPEERDIWLRALGATDIALEVETFDDGTIWDRWRFRDVWVEAGWQQISDLEAHLQRVLHAETLEHASLVLAEVVAYAVPLRSTGALGRWQGELSHYPEALQRRLIAATVERWSSPYTAITRWSTLRRGQALAFTEEVIGDVHAVLRLLFALNREWEPDWKWIAALDARLARKPARLSERIAACFGQAPALEQMRICTQLILDTLTLLPPTPDIEQARVHLQQGMEANRVSRP